MPSILFVCTGNICRSPMAGALFASKVGSDPQAQGWVIETAGTWAVDGLPASENAQIVIHDWGLDIRSHRSRRVDADLIDRFDVIITMEANHKEALLAEFSHLDGRVHLLSEVAGESGDVEDPLGGTLDAYEATARRIDHLINRGFKQILALAQT